MEYRENNVEIKAMSLVSEFVKKFRTIDFTLHPSDIPGESPGKGSNVAWAARKLSEKYTMEQRKDVIVHAGTGFGKTAIAAGPHYHDSAKGGVTLMISPLIALHDEQVSISYSIDYVNSPLEGRNLSKRVQAHSNCCQQ